MRTPKLLLPWDQWPAVDRSAWNAAVHPGNMLEDGGRASHWAPRSQRTVLFGYRRWLGHLALHEPDALDLDPSDRIIPDHVQGYITALRASITPAGTHNYVKHLHDAARIMWPDEDWTWLREVARRLAQLVEPPNKRPRMKSSSQLLDLGIDLMSKAQASTDMRPKDRALLYRDGLIIGLFATRAFRRRTFAAIRIGTTLIRVGQGYALTFRPQDTKNHQSLETSVPEVLVPYLDTYLKTYRLMIFGSDRHDGLWASAKGRPMTEEAIYERVCLHTRRAFGESVNPHLFRDCLATEIAIRDPENVAIAAHMLGHIDPTITERYYIQAETLEAGRKYQEGVMALRERLEQSEQNKRSSKET